MTIRIARVNTYVGGCALAALMTLSGCHPQTTTPGAGTGGTASVKIQLVPTGTACIVVTVVGPTPPGTTVTDQYTVSPQTSSTFSLLGLPLGSDTFSASSYTAPCTQVTSATTANYVSNTVSATLTGMAPADVVLDMGNGSGEAVVGVNFPTLSGSITEYASDGTDSAGQGDIGSSPMSIVAGPDGALWFTAIGSTGGNGIGRITVNGVLTNYGVDAGLSVSLGGTNPQGIAAGPDGNVWFVSSATVNGQAVSAIGRITTGTSPSITQFTLPSKDAAGNAVVNPDAITAGPDGNLWFGAGQGGAQEQIGFITTGGNTGAADIFDVAIPYYGDTRGIAVGSDGNLWSIDGGGFNIVVSSTSGATLATYIINTTAVGPQCTCSITAGPDGNLWFTEAQGGGIVRITTSGAFTFFPVPTANSVPAGITAGPDGNIWFTEFGGNNIGRITPSGVITEFPIPTANSQPLGITAGPDGNIWFTEFGGNKIGVLAIL
jgi:streptogramin lyase